MLEKIFGLRKENGQLIFIFFGIKMRFKSPCINQLEEVCCIQNLAKIKQKNTKFPHPVGIVIHPKVNIGVKGTN